MNADNIEMLDLLVELYNDIFIIHSGSAIKELKIKLQDENYN